MSSASIGEPDFATPWHIREAGIPLLCRIRKRGIPRMRDWMDAVRPSGHMSNGSLTREYVPRKPKSRLTVGGSEAIDMALRAVINPGDGGVVPEPSFVCYAPLA